jgi:hypothetical protein
MTIPASTLLFMVLASSLAVALITMLREVEPKLVRVKLRDGRGSRDRTR